MNDRFKIITSWDDGTRSDFIVASLLKKYQIPGIFYLPNTTTWTETEILRLSEDFGIGGHTVHHPADLKKLSLIQAKREIEINKKWLESIIGRGVTSFCYPRGRYNQEVLDLVKEAGYQEARTTVLTKRSADYSDAYRIRASAQAYERDEYHGQDWLLACCQAFDLAQQSGGIFHLWGHSSEIDKNQEWQKLEALFKYLHDKSLYSE